MSDVRYELFHLFVVGTSKKTTYRLLCSPFPNILSDGLVLLARGRHHLVKVQVGMGAFVSAPACWRLMTLLADDDDHEH